ncbi:MAG: tripartite tricarboxylate transporter substrate binding protein [Firmicutes bacterium]|jgi:tripartite-type tricarboxylate transporter receptor subunit TctC|nr:tripartite tricarboxylate transporter substrate binding protein [Bacillota bacterium]
MRCRTLGRFIMLASLALMICLASTGLVGASTDWPKRPITLIIPFAPGGATDLVARALKPHMEKVLGVPMAATNMAGAATAVGHKFVWDAPHDGYTLLTQPTDITSIAVMDQYKSTYKDWHVLGVAVAVPAVFVVHPDSPYKTIQDMVADMMKRQITVSVAARGCAWTRAIMLFSNVLGTKPPQLVPMGGGNPAAVSAMKKEVDVGACGLPEAIDLIMGKKLRVLGFWGAEDVEVPGYGIIQSIAKSYPQLAEFLPFGGWVGMSYPKDTPAAILEKAQKAYDYAVSTPEFTKFVKDSYFALVGLTGPAAADYVAKSTSVNAWLLYDLQIAPISPAEFGIPRP